MRYAKASKQTPVRFASLNPQTMSEMFQHWPIHLTCLCRNAEFAHMYLNHLWEEEQLSSGWFSVSVVLLASDLVPRLNSSGWKRVSPNPFLFNRINFSLVFIYIPGSFNIGLISFIRIYRLPRVQQPCKTTKHKVFLFFILLPLFTTKK